MPSFLGFVELPSVFWKLVHGYTLQEVRMAPEDTGHDITECAECWAPCSSNRKVLMRRFWRMSQFSALLGEK